MRQAYASMIEDALRALEPELGPAGTAPVPLAGAGRTATTACGSAAAVAVELFGEWVAGEVAAEPLWDAKGLRVRM